jgi:hypothetical protein
MPKSTKTAGWPATVDRGTKRPRADDATNELTNNDREGVGELVRITIIAASPEHLLAAQDATLPGKTQAIAEPMITIGSAYAAGTWSLA